MKGQTTGPSLSAVFVDYDNIYLSLKRKSEDAAKRFAKDAHLWLREIESGRLITPSHAAFDSCKRRIVMNRCYGNPVPRRNSHDNSTDMSSFPFVRHHFLRAGFEVVDCPPLTAQLKNSSDIRMVMDVRDYLTHDTYFDEFIILSGDADFTPVLHRLRAHARRTVIFANDYTAAPYTALSDGEVREQDLIALLLNGRTLPDEAGDQRPHALAGPAKLDAARREILADVVASVRAAAQPVPLEALADRAVRGLGHEKTIGTAWGGAGSFRDLLVKDLPHELRLSEQPPYHVFAAGHPVEAARPEPLRAEPIPPDALEPESLRREPIRQDAVPAQPIRPEPPRPDHGRAQTIRPDPFRGEPVASELALRNDKPASAERVYAQAAIAAQGLPQRGAMPPAPPPMPQALSAGGQTAMPDAAHSPAPAAQLGRGPADIAAVAPSAPQPPPLERSAPQLAPPRSAPSPASTAAAPRPNEGATAIQQSIARIHEACQAPPLSPPEYRVLFEVMAKEITGNGLAGGQTLINIAQRAQEIGVDVRREDVRFVLEVVSEADPWFEQGASANLFASRFRNFVVARCRGQGLSLSADELDLIDAWFAAPGTAERRPAAPAAPTRATAPQLSSQPLYVPSSAAASPEPTRSDRWWGADMDQRPAELRGASFGAEPSADEEFPRIVRTRLRG